MTDIFKTVLILSLLGSGLTALLLCLKPVSAKKFPAKWQYYMWICVLFCMLIPAYKVIPAREVQKIPILPQPQTFTAEFGEHNAEVPPVNDGAQMESEAEKNGHFIEHRVSPFEFLGYIWLSGVLVYLAVVCGSYAVFVRRKRRHAVAVTDDALLKSAAKTLKIGRRILLCRAEDSASPMLVGVVKPVIYIPQKEIADENMRMVLLHELMHYKRKDLAVKWLAIFVNALHWFNPFAYLLCANISEACEVSCDMEVTKNMAEEEQKLYMKTILDLAG